MELGEDIELTQLRLRRMRELANEGRRTSEASTSRPTVLTDNSFDRFAKSNRLVIVDFWASWCGPCMMMSPILDKLASEYSGKIAFGKLNVDENPSTSSRYGIMSIPTLIIFNNGEVVDRIVGAHPIQSLRDKLDAILSKYG